MTRIVLVVAMLLLAWCGAEGKKKQVSRVEKDLDTVVLPGPVWDGPKDAVWTTGPPYVWTLHDFLSDSECEELIRWCEEGKHFSPSPVGTDGKTGDWGRNSTTCWMTGPQTEVMKRAQAKAARVAGVTLEHMEPLQMVKYLPTQWYHKHHDWFADACVFPNNRYVTILVYLNDNYTEGKTSFPQLKAAVSPRKGSAVFWYNCWQRTPGVTTCFDDSLHQGNPPTTGTKYALNVWIRMAPDYRDNGCKPKRNKEGTSGSGTIRTPYTATVTSEATVEVGDVVHQYGKSPNGWADVYVERTKKRGWIPHECVALDAFDDAKQEQEEEEEEEQQPVAVQRTAAETVRPTEPMADAKTEL